MFRSFRAVPCAVVMPDDFEEDGGPCTECGAQEEEDCECGPDDLDVDEDDWDLEECDCEDEDDLGG